MNTSSLQLSVMLAALTLVVPTSVGQPIINVPDDPAPEYVDGSTVLNVNDGGILNNRFTADENSTVNLFEGGTIRDLVEFRTNSELNNFGGRVSGRLSTREDATINMTGGVLNGEVSLRGSGGLNLSGGAIMAPLEVSSKFELTGGDAGPRTTVGPSATASIRGGTLGGFHPRTNSNTSIYGSEFLLNGTPITGFDAIGESVQFNLPEGGFFSGILSDGTPFVFTSAHGDQIEDNALTLVRTAAALPGPANIDVPTDFGGWGVRSGQTVTVRDGGQLSNNFNAAPGSSVIVDGGYVGQNLEALGAEVTLLDGRIGKLLTAFEGTRVRIEGGNISTDFEAWSGSEVLVNGGIVDNGVVVYGGADFTVNGGLVGLSSAVSITTKPNSLLTISGGQVGSTVIEGVLRVNGGTTGYTNVKESGQIEVHEGYVTLVGLTTSELLMTAGEIGQVSSRFDGVLDIRGGSISSRLTMSSGSHLYLSGGTVGNQFEAVQAGTKVEISGGTIGDDGNAISGATINMTGGNIGKRFLADDGAIVTMSNGTIGKEFQAQNGSELHVTGGFVDISLKAQRDSVVTITGGEIGAFMLAESGAMVSIHGGLVGPLFKVRDATVEMEGGEVGPLMTLESGAHFSLSGGILGEGFTALEGATLDIFGQAFTINGNVVSGLDEWNDSIVVSEREGALLEGLLADGKPFQFRLNGQSQSFQDFIDPQATLRLTLVPEPGTGTLLLVGLGALLSYQRLRRRIQSKTLEAFRVSKECSNQNDGSCQ